MWFIIALFGGLYWVVRLSLNGAEQKQAIKKCNEDADIYKRFLESIYDTGLERYLMRKVSDPEYEDEIISEIGREWDSLPAIYPVQSFRTITREKVAILMAKQGLLTFTNMIRPCSCIEQKRYQALNILIRDKLNQNNRNVELDELVDGNGFIISTTLKPREICDKDGVLQATTPKTKSRCNSQFEREREGRMRSWIERCPHGKDFPVSPDRYGTEEEYQEAVRQAYEQWKSNRSLY